jgi:hypothetical protein
MKNREYTIIKVYTQANGEKIAVSMLHKTKKGYYEEIKPTAAVEKYGKIEGEIVSYWGKLPVVLVPVEQFAALKKEYEIIEYRGPVECTRIRESKPRPDAAALKLYKVFAADAAAPQEDAYITVDGYRFPSGAGEYLLKALKREYTFTKSDIAAAYALTLDNAAADAAEQPAAPVVDAPAADAVTPANQKNETTPANQKTAADEYIETGAFPVWYNSQLECTSGNGVDFKVVSWGRKQVKVEYYDGQRRIYKVQDFINSVENGSIIVSAPYDAEYMAMLKRKQQQPAALTDADVLAAAARIKSNYEAMKQQAAADAYADAITAYCDTLEEPAAPAWVPEIITITPCPAWDDTPAADELPAPAPRHRRRLNIAPRLSRWLHPARWVAVAFAVCLLSGLLLGMNTSTAADTDAAADGIAAVYELHPVTVTAAATPANQKTASDITTATAPAAADAVNPSNQKTASDLATASAPAADDAGSLTTAPVANGLQPTPPDGLTICAGTVWAYTMMNWA